MLSCSIQPARLFRSIFPKTGEMIGGFKDFRAPENFRMTSFAIVVIRPVADNEFYLVIMGQPGEIAEIVFRALPAGRALDIQYSYAAAVDDADIHAAVRLHEHCEVRGRAGP